jgi:trigger factor
MGRNLIEDAQRNESDVDVADDEEDIKTALGRVIDVAVADAGVLRKTLRVTVPRESVDHELNKEFKELIREATVPGFRRGRAPRRLVEKRFGSEVGAQVQTRVVSHAYLAAIEKQKLRVLGDPLVWVRTKAKDDKAGEAQERLVDMPTALQQMKLPDEGPLEFKCEVEVKPEFELPDLEGVEVERPELSITEDDVTQEIKRRRARRGSWAPVVGGKVEIDDLLVCDMVMTVDGKEIKKAENIQIAARPQRVEGVTLEDLGARLQGLTIGDRQTFTGALPDDYEVADLRGKPATFGFSINDIKRLELPPLNKEALATMGFDSEKEYREFVRKQMQDQLEIEVKRGLRNQVRRYLLEKTKLELPEGISSRQTDRAVQRRVVELRQQGVPDAEIEKHADELKTVAREEVSTELKLYFVLEEIAEKFQLEVTEEEINAQIAAIARAYNRRFDRIRDDLANSGGIESLYVQIRDDKCIDKILEKARIVKADLPKKAPAAPQKSAKAAADSVSERPEKAEETQKPAGPKKAGAERPKVAKKAARRKSDE